MDYVNNILELSRLESEKIQYEQTEVEAIALCREIVGFINGQVEDENAKVVLQTAVESQTICTDRKWLMSLLRGLLVSGEGGGSCNVLYRKRRSRLDVGFSCGRYIVCTRKRKR